MLEISKRLSDRYFKFAGVPFAALMVIVLYSFFTTEEIISWSVIDYLYLIIVSVTMWFGNVKLHYALRPALYRIKRISLRILTRFSITIIFSIISSFLLLSAWNYLLHHSAYQAKTIFTLQMITTLISLVVGSIYEITYLHKERESDIVKMERTERSKVQAQLDGLKNQLDPHFIFNSLNTLSYLISQNPETARLFNDTLAKVYRYILIKKEKDLVLLKEEIEFASNYFYLLKIRYQAGLTMTIAIDDIIAESYLLPPLSLQILIENAIKHNHFTEKSPLDINITVIKDRITVSNNRSVKQFEMQSPQIGLKNLAERYQLITNQQIRVTDDKLSFAVVLPILKS